MPRDRRRVAAPEPQASAEGQRECSRGNWCASRAVTIENGERIVKPALGPRAFCDHDADLIAGCISELPAIFGRLQAEIAEPVAADTSVHVPFGPSIPLRLDIDAAMRLTATLLRIWERRVRSSARLAARPEMPVLSAESVEDAAKTLEKHLGVLLALQPGWMTHNAPLPPGRMARATATGQQARCRRCGRRITRSAASGEWWAADSAITAMGSTTTAKGLPCKHVPADGTITEAPAPLPPDLLEQFGEQEIVRVGADFIGVFIQRDGAAAGLEILHLHYWDRAVLRETPARPEELLGVECRACSLLALRRAEPPWHKGDPEHYSECAECGDLMGEDEYRLWVGQLAAYHEARLAAMPVLSAAEL